MFNKLAMGTSEAEKRRVADALNRVHLTARDFLLEPGVREELRRGDLEEYKARHPELFPETNL